MSKHSVLVVHNRYRERGGEDSVFEAESTLLESQGHRVGRLLFDNDELPEHPSPLQAMGLALGTVWSRTGRARLREAVESFKPDVVHFHNTLPQVSPAAYSVCHEAGAAVVQTLHNYRLVCPSGLLFRDGRPCEDCVGHSLALPGVAHACYRGSRAQSGTVAAMVALHRLRGTWDRDVDLYVATSEFQRRKLIEGGVPAGLLVSKHCFVEPDPGVGRAGGGYVLLASRLTASKGVETVLKAYREHPDLPPLHILGDGELADSATAAAEDGRISFIRRVGRDAVMEEMGNAMCLVFPSLWYEGFGLIAAEAYARGLPVVASDIGALSERIEDGRTGLHFRPGDSDDLASKLRTMAMHPERTRAMGRLARKTYLEKYTAERNYELLIACYDRALAEMKQRSGSLLGEKDTLSERIPAKP